MGDLALMTRRPARAGPARSHARTLARTHARTHALAARPGATRGHPLGSAPAFRREPGPDVHDRDRLPAEFSGEAVTITAAAPPAAPPARNGHPASPASLSCLRRPGPGTPAMTGADCPHSSGWSVAAFGQSGRREQRPPVPGYDVVVKMLLL
jgi:hypothetical protein